MFDRTLIMPRVDGGTHHHHHTEKRAPTDESVKLLREMEQAAQDKLDASIRLEANGFECVVQVFERMIDGDFAIVVHFSLNGNRHKVEYFHDPRHDYQSLGRGVLKSVSEEIARSAIPALAETVTARFGKSFFQRKGA